MVTRRILIKIHLHNEYKLNTNPHIINESAKFTRDMIWVALSQIITAALGILLLPILTKSYSTEAYGIWTQVNVTNALIVPVLMLALDTAVITFLAGEEDHIKRRRSLGGMFSAILIFAVIMFVIVNIFAHQLSNLIFNNPSYTHFVLLTFLWTFVDCVFAFFISYMRARRQIIKLSFIQVGLYVGHVIVIVCLVPLGIGLEWVIAWIILADTLFAIGTMFLIARQDGFPTLNFTGIMKFLSFALPQVPAVLLMWIIASSDRFFITHFLGLSKTGIYSSSDLIGAMETLVYTPIAYVLFPVISKAWEQHKKDNVQNYIEYSTKLFLTLAIPAAVGLSMLSQPLLRIITTSEYLVGWQLVLLVSVGTIFQGLFQINIYLIYLIKQTKWIPLIATVCAVISASLNYVLVPRIGIIGGAVSTCVSYFMLASIYFLWARKIIAYKIDLLFLGKVIVASFLIVLFLHYFKATNILDIIFDAIAGIVIFVLAIFLLRAFSEQDKKLIKESLSGFIPRRH